MLISKYIKIYQKYSDSSGWWEFGARGTLLYCWWDGKLAQSLWNSIWWFLRELEINQPQKPAIPFPNIYPKNVSSYHKDINSTMFITVSFIVARNQKWPRCSSTKEWIKRMWYICTMEYYPASKIMTSWKRQANGYH